MANGLGDRLSTSDVSAAARLDRATPARISVMVEARAEAMAMSAKTHTAAPASAPAGNTSSEAPATPV